MRITHQITGELTRRETELPLDAVQGDGSTRAVKISLLENGTPWEVPAGVTAAVAFRKADGHKGLYDTLPDGTKAVTIDGSTVTAVLAPQVLSCPGEVSAAVVFYDAGLKQLATFPFTIRVQANPAAGQALSNDYYRYSSMEAVSQAVEDALASLENGKQAFLAKAQEALQTVHDTATADAPAIVCEAMGQTITVSDAASRPLQGLTLYGKTVQNGTPTPENPVPLVSVGAGGVINTTVAGKNLLPNNANTATISGITFTVNADGSVTVNGTNNGSGSAILTLCEFAFEKGKQYVLSGLTDSTAQKMHIWTQSANAFPIGSRLQCYDGEVTRTAQADETCVIRIQVEPGATINNVTIFPMLRFATVTDGTYEPYKGQTLTTSTPNGLPGIPVSGGGNYTDESGQAWICDEIDFARGVYVQRVYNEAFSNLTWSAAWDPSFHVDGTFIVNATIKNVVAFTANAATTHFVAGHGILTTSKTMYSFAGGGGKVFAIRMPTSVASSLAQWNTWCSTSNAHIIYELETPIETALSEQALAQFAALRSYKPNTTVFNDSGAGMKLAYTADTKVYIDSRIAVLSAAFLA